jgi:hypothetical protein
MAYNGPLPQVVNAGGTGQLSLTNHGVLVGAATSAITQLSVGSNGQVLIGATTADPAFATLSSSDSSISFTTGANTLSLQVAGGTTTIKTITGNSGGAESPSAGNFNILGTGSITVAGTANTETIQLTGLTNHAIQIGAGTATLTQLGAGTTGQVLQTNTTADPTWSTATYPSTTTINDILYSSSNNVVGQITTAIDGVLITNHTGIPSILANSGTAGFVLTANSGAPPSWQVSPASSISITGNSGGALTGNSFTFTGGTTGLTFSGSGTTETLTGILIGANGGTGANNTTTTTGTILRSNGTAFVPTTATYPTTTTSQQILYSTANSVVGELTTANSKFPATNSSGTLAMRAFSVVRQVFTTPGANTYTPTAGMLFCDVEVVGGGGGGGGAATSGVGQAALGSGGGGGGYARKIVSAATIGASQTATVGAAGTAGAAGNNNGGTGGTTSLGAIVSATGGVGGNGAATNNTGTIAAGAGGAGSSGDFNTTGNPGGETNWAFASLIFVNSYGGSSFFGGGANAIAAVAGAGNAATSYGGGGGGALTANSAQQAGGAGFAGIVVITEYVIA